MTDATIDFRALARFRFILRQFLAFSAEQARGVGLEPRQHQLLLALCGLPADVQPTIGALAEQLLVRHHSATELVTRMEKKGLVSRRPAEDDGRVVLVDITPHGHDLLSELSRAHRDQLHTSGPALIAALTKAVSASEHPRDADQATNDDGVAST